MKPTERIINTQIDLKDLPISGILCLHESSVLKMVKMLGWELSKGDIDHERLAFLEQGVLEYEAQINYIKESLPA